MRASDGRIMSLINRVILRAHGLSAARVILFAVLLLVLRGCVNAIFDGPTEVSEEATVQSVLGFLLVRYLPNATVVIALLLILGRMQVLLPYLHAFLVVVLHEVLAFAILLVGGWDATSTPFWVLDYLVLVVCAVVGTAIGIRLRPRGR